MSGTANPPIPHVLHRAQKPLFSLYIMLEYFLENPLTLVLLKDNFIYFFQDDVDGAFVF